MLLKLKIAPQKYHDTEHLQTDLDRQSKNHQKKGWKKNFKKTFETFSF